MVETDPGKDIFNKIFTDLLDKTIIKRYSRLTSLGAVFAERFIRTIRDLLRRPVSKRGDANWVDVLPSITKQYFEGSHSSTKLTSIQCFSKKNEAHTHQILLDKGKKRKPKYKPHDLTRSANLNRTFSRGDSTKWLYKLYDITEVVMDTIPSYHFNNLPERYNETLLKKTKFRLRENFSVIRKLNIFT